MSDKQKTLKNEIKFTGKGLHSGAKVELTLKPAAENYGFKFQRIDLENKPIIRAVAENVTETSRGTTITEKGVSISTIEHVMAAMNGLDLDNVLLEIDGPEMPIIDGSSKPFVEGIKNAGIVEQEAEREYFVVKTPINFTIPEKGIEIDVYPYDGFCIDVLIDYNSKILGNQYATMRNIEEFEGQIAPSRTFVFLREVEFLFKNNLIKGGDLENAIVIMENAVAQEELDRLADLFNMPKIKAKPEGILNNIDLRFSNEPARHKLLDIVGDIALTGKKLKAKIVATKPGHFANTELAKIIRKEIKKKLGKPVAPDYDPNEKPLLDVNQIKAMLPHRSPFLLVDKLIKRTDDLVVGVKNVTMDEPFFVGHFPDEPVMPGVLQIESMAQVGGLLVLNTVPDPENYTTYFLKIDKARFKQKVVPGDTLIIRMSLVDPIRRGIALMYGEAFVGDTLVAEAEMMAQIVKVK